MFDFLKRKKKPPVTEEPQAASAQPDNTAVVPSSQGDTQKGTQQIDQEEQRDSAEPADQASQAKQGFFSRLRQGLTKTRKNFSQGLGNLLFGKKVIDQDLLVELEDYLLLADVGIEASQRVIQSLTEKVSRKELADGEALMAALKVELTAILTPCEQNLQIHSSKQPYVILMVGVNGAGKTTTIGKLAKQFQNQGKSVMLAAGDTFRAAAIEQLQVWGERHQIPVIAQQQGSDSASVAYDALQSAQAKAVDVLIIDTAGRLHTQTNLMQELAKVRRVLGKLEASAPHEVLLVLDAGNGQNALNQAQQFHQAVAVSGVVLTKLDGTAKGGIIFALAEKLGLPIRFIGIGEQVNDLKPFAASAFVDALFTHDSSTVTSTTQGNADDSL